MIERCFWKGMLDKKGTTATDMSQRGVECVTCDGEKKNCPQKVEIDIKTDGTQGKPKLLGS